MTRLLGVKLSREEDVVTARQRARQVADALGFDHHDQTRIATAVSEIARNAFRYAGGGQVQFVLDTARSVMGIVVVDEGRGIADLEAVLGGTYQSPTGLGLGISGSRRVMDRFEVTTVL